MSTQNTAEWNGDTLTAVNHYEWPNPHTCTLQMRRVDLTDPQCGYWVACDGQAFGICEPSGQCCIAAVENALRLAGARAVYVIWTPKNRTASTLKTWIKKWTKRTSAVDPWDTSVRVFA